MGRADMWSTRLYHESMFHDESAFITLTYHDWWLPDSYSVEVRPLQLFMKRLRKSLPDKRIRFFACGEYGDINFRPHFHALVFGTDFPDKIPWRKTASGFVTYRSPHLERLWPFGHSEIGTATPQSAGYVARYVTKKITGDHAKEHYTRTHPITGELVQVKPEFLTMSKNIGKEWFDKFHVDAFPSDFVIVNGVKKPIPRYYMKLIAEQTDNIRRYGNDLPLTQAEIDQANLVDQVRQQREEVSAGPVRPDDTPERRAVREEVAMRRLQQLKRDHDNES